MKTMINLITKEIYMTNDTMNKFMNLSNEVDSILANVEEKIQKFEEQNNVDLNSSDLSYKLKEVTEHINDNYNDQ
jgi:gas vesicle protein|tara:strand:- start:458 stop:682 length:225 start_codon:yes stop_codon:yes gene_type:complete